MRHVYECPMRWADLDLLGHVNNVVYVDYLQEARVDLLRAHGRSPGAALIDGLVVVRHEVSYLRPLYFRGQSIRIECWVTQIRAASLTMAYEIIQDGQVCARATTVLTPYVFETERPRRISPEERALLTEYLEPAEVHRPPRFESSTGARCWDYPVHVRFSDVDVYGHVNNVKYFEYVQEARIQMMQDVWAGLHPDSPRPMVVVAQLDVDYKVPLMFRGEPYRARTWFTHVGRTSAICNTEIWDGEVLQARARTVHVFFDRAAERPIEPAAELAALLRAGLAPEHH